MFLSGWTTFHPLHQLHVFKEVQKESYSARSDGWDAASSTTRVQIITPGSPVVVAAGSRGVVVQRENISPAHPGNKRKGSALRQGMGAVIQEKEKGGVTHCKDPLLTAKKRGPLTYHR